MTWNRKFYHCFEQYNVCIDHIFSLSIHSLFPLSLSRTLRLGATFTHKTLHNIFHFSIFHFLCFSLSLHVHFSIVPVLLSLSLSIFSLRPILCFLFLPNVCAYNVLENTYNNGSKSTLSKSRWGFEYVGVHTCITTSHNFPLKCFGGPWRTATGQWQREKREK